MSRQDIVNATLDRLRSVCKMKGIAETKPFTESTELIGSGAVLDSLGIVLLLVQVEESLSASNGSSVSFVQRLFTDDLASETIGSLADRIHLIVDNRQ
jgi:hypothetical protein